MLLFAAAAVAADPDTAHGWARYRNNELGEGCDMCHGTFLANPYVSPKGANWPSSLHAVHTDFGYMATACDVCHHVTDGWLNPYLNMSNGTATAPGHGCSGCHGRDYGAGWPLAVGLVTHHMAYAANANCDTCHNHQGLPPPLAESEPPEYYGLPDTRANHTCNNDLDASEDWSGDGQGLDNDGDGLYDTDDPDCPEAVCGNGVAETPEVCDGSDLAGQDCTTIGQGYMGGTLACLADCTDWDTTGCLGEGDCGNGVVDPGETCDPPSSCPTSCPSDAPCTRGVLTGSAGQCNAECTASPILACLGGDGCCPAGCDLDNDSDCTSYGSSDPECGCRGAPSGRPVTVFFVLLAAALVALAIRRRNR